MSRTGTPSVIATITSIPASTASRIASAVKAAGTKIIVALAPVSCTASFDGVEDRQPLRGLAALARRHAAHHLRAILQATASMEFSGGSSNALANHPRLFVN